MLTKYLGSDAVRGSSSIILDDTSNLEIHLFHLKIKYLVIDALIGLFYISNYMLLTHFVVVNFDIFLCRFVEIVIRSTIDRDDMSK